MCVMVYNGEEVIGTVGELKKEFPEVPLILCEGCKDSDAKDEYCLCPVDLAAMFKQAGIEYKYDGDFNILDESEQ